MRDLGGRIIAMLAAAACVLPLVAAGTAEAAVAPTGIGSWTAKTVPVPANDVAYDSTRDVVLAVVMQTNASLGNELVELDPDTGAIGRHVFVGSDPGRIALTDDGTLAYIALRGANRIVTVDLSTFTVLTSFSVSADSFFGPAFVEDLEAVPGRNDQVVASLQFPGTSPRHAGVRVFDDGVALPNSTPTHTGANRIEIANATTVYGYNNETTEYGLRTITIDGNGASVTSTGAGAITGFGVDIEYALGRLYSTSGLMVDPVTRNAVGSFSATGLIEVTPADSHVSVLNGTTLSVFSALTGQPLESRTFAGIPAATDLEATGTGFATASSTGVTLLGPTVGGPPVVPPPPPPGTVTALHRTDVSIDANAIEYDDQRDLVYATIRSTAASRANEVVALDPRTGAVVSSLFVGSNPGPMALAPDRSVLHVGLNTTGQIARIDLDSFEATGSFSLGTSRLGGPEIAGDLEVRPGTTDVIAVALRNTCCSPAHDGVAIFVNGTRLPDSTPVHTGPTRLEFADANTLFGMNDGSFYRMAVDGNGVRVTATFNRLITGSASDFELADGRLYATGGGIADPVAMEQIGRFDGSGAIEVAPSAGRAYFAQDQQLREFDLARFRFVASLPLPGSGTVTSLVATGDGFAMIMSGGRIGFLNPPLPISGRFHAVTPERILDTRFGNGSPVAPVGPGGVIELQVTGRGGVPATGVTAVALTVTATGPTASSWLTAWPTGQTAPLASNLNYAAGQTAANLVIVPLGTDGRVSLANANGTTHLIADVAGWYGDGTDITGALYSSLLPARILDTRTGNGAPPAVVGPGGVVELQVAGRGGVPFLGATAVALTVTATGPTASSWLTAWPTGQTAPLASNLNYAAGQTAANLVIVPLGANGRVSLANANGTTHLIADIAGWYGAGGANTGASFRALPPERVLDTRFGNGSPVAPVGPGGVIELQVTGRGGVPATGVTAVALTVTATGPTASSWLTAWPTGQTPPLASNLNYAAGQTAANLVIVPVGTDGKVSLANANGTTHLIADIAGWFGPPP